MSIPKKGSRKIVVGDKEYRWSVRDNLDTKTISIQYVDQGQILLSNLNEWHCGEAMSIPITPKAIRYIIESAIVKGWKPELKKQKPIGVGFPYHLTDVEI